MITHTNIINITEKCGGCLVFLRVDFGEGGGGEMQIRDIEFHGAVKIIIMVLGIS